MFLSCTNLGARFDQYIQELPENTTDMMAVGFLIDGMIHATASGGNILFGVVNGALSALAVAVHALVSPLFRRLTPLMGRDGNFHIIGEMVRGMSATIITYGIAQGCGLAMTPLSPLAPILYGSLLAVFHQYPQVVRNPDRANIVVAPQTSFPAWGVRP